MPQGYLVSLGDTSLDNGDVISGAYVTFTTDTNLGSGSWTWSGVAGGTNYTNEVEPGIYYLATNGNIYFEPQFGAVDTINSAQATNPPAYSSNDGTVSGTAGDDIIEDGYTGDPDTDTITAVADIIDADAGNDTVRGGGGNDTIDGGTGDDFLVGARQRPTTARTAFLAVKAMTRSTAIPPRGQTTPQQSYHGPTKVPLTKAASRVAQATIRSPMKIWASRRMAPSQSWVVRAVKHPTMATPPHSKVIRLIWALTLISRP